MTTTPEPGATPTERAHAVLDLVGRVVVGQDRVLREMMIALLAGGHALLEGVPGTAKTLAVRGLARAMDIGFGRVQFTPDLMPSDISGVSVFDPAEQRFTFRRGPIFADLLLADEINRAPAKTQAALLEAMQEGQVTVDGASHRLPRAFTVFASQNPIEFEGTFPLPEAELDRFLLRIEIPYPSAEAEIEILDRHADGFDASWESTFGIEPILGEEELIALRRMVRTVRVEPGVRAYMVEIVRATREIPGVLLGASPRGAVALLRVAQASAFLSGRDFVTPDDVKGIAVAALSHRLVLSSDAEIEGQTPAALVHSALDRVEAPRA